jgi:hypothetical protein
MDKLQIIDALKWVQSRPVQFFGKEKPDGVDLLSYIMADVVELGSGDCRIRKIDDWYIVGSGRAWLANSKYTISELFTHVVPEPSHGRHSMRGEILLTAYAQDVAVLEEGGGISLIKGDCPVVIAAAAVGMRQAIAFRLAIA